MIRPTLIVAFAFFVVASSSCGPVTASSCNKLAACCPATEAESSCKVTAQMGNEAQCASTFAGFQDIGKCPKDAWGCAQASDDKTVAVCAGYLQSDYGTAQCTGSMKVQPTACGEGFGECKLKTGKVASTLGLLFGTAEEKDKMVAAAKTLCESLGGAFTAKTRFCSKTQVEACVAAGGNVSNLGIECVKCNGIDPADTQKVAECKCRVDCGDGCVPARSTSATANDSLIGGTSAASLVV